MVNIQLGTLYLENHYCPLLEEKYNTAEDARKEWEAQAREREVQRDRADSIRMVELQKIEKEYRSKQDSLYQLT